MGAGDAKIATALISLSDKAGAADFARGLARMGVSLVSTGGTAAMLRAEGLPVRAVEDLTGFPEILDGRVKTLHPAIHAGLLARGDSPAHADAMAAHGLVEIGLLAVNLYPFEETAARGAAFAECVENIDIGGPALIRAAAKNHERVTVVTDPADYPRVLAEMAEHGGATRIETRRELAAKAYAFTAVYDAAISRWFAATLGIDAPAHFATGGRLIARLRYGENPHQSAAFYREAGAPARFGVATARLVQGKELSYNNINDTDAAYEAVAEFGAADGPAVVIVKHANPCGAALGPTLAEAYRRALACDPQSAFGGVIALNQPLDGETASEIAGIFTEVIIAPSASEEAVAIIAARKNLRLLLAGGLPDARASGLAYRSVAGGLLVQSRDAGSPDDLDLRVVTRRPPTPRELADLRFAFRVAKHVKSNAIVYARDGATVGVGAGQMSRVDAARIAAWKAAEAARAAGAPAPLTQGSVVASDAFFPFADGLVAAADAGATAVIQPGGSVRDEEVIAAADARGLAMVFAGVRHFRH